MEPKVTVLMAVYNAEAYLKRSIESLLQQTLSDIQIVCVDDGSTDNSLSILQYYASQDQRIEVLALKENGGPARARQAGLEMVRGTLVTFLDSDDWMASDALEQAVKVMATDDETDTVLFRLMCCNEKGNETPWPMDSFAEITGKDAFAMSIGWNGIHGCCVHRMSVIKRVPLDTSNKVYADENMTRLRLYYSRKVKPCTGTYYYYLREASITRTVSVRRFDVLLTNEYMSKLLPTLDVPRTVAVRHENMRYLLMIDMCMFYHQHKCELSREERKYAFNLLHRIWKDIDRTLLDTPAARKFGHRPMNHWWWFCVNEWVYFTLRGWLGR